MKYFLNSFLIYSLLMCFKTEAQRDTLALVYRLGYCTLHCNAASILDSLEKKNLSKEKILEIATYIAYHGSDECANALMKLCISRNDSITAGNWHTYSVQNTKNGNYTESYQALEKSLAINAKEMEGYYGWVLLYYYRDYERALQHLNHYDDLTPNDMDAPVGENIHFLKGLCYYQEGQYQKAILEFKINEHFEISHFGQKNCNTYIYFYTARAFEKLNDLKQSEFYYKKAIKQSRFPVEANYYLGLLYMRLQKKELAKYHILQSLKFITQGYKQQDIYVELFDEVYPQQIEEALISFK